MAQHDYNIANQTFPNTRTDINNALSAVASNNSGTAAPSTTFANQWFYETDTNLLQIRNEDNDAYITIAELDQSNDTVEYFKSDSIRTALIEFTDGDDAITIADGGGCTFPIASTFTAGFTSNDGCTITTADNTAQLTLTSTDADANAGPLLIFKRDSASPADSDFLANIQIEMDNDAGDNLDAVSILAQATDVSNASEDAKLYFYVRTGGSIRDRFSIAPSETIFNEDSVDVDFRVEGNGDANAFFVEGSTDHIGMGTNDPDSPLHVFVGSAGSVTAFDTTGVTIEDSDNATLNFLSPDSGQSRILFGAPSDNVGASIKWGHDTNAFEIKGGTGSSELQLGGAQSTQMIIKNSGYVGINTESPSAHLEVHSNNNIVGIETQPKVDQLHYAMIFRNSSGNDVGNIAATSSNTSFNTSSDYRLKENVSYDFDATSRLKQLKPARFNWISDDTNTLQDGFLAHEVSDIVPEAINGEKDATETRTKVVLDSNGNQLARNVDESEWTQGKTNILFTAQDEINGEGTEGEIKEPAIYPSNSTWEASKVYPKHQKIDQSKLVPLLVKTIQELEARITILES
tara:strand:- start:40 stop:1764 length:1725 start_codon:yes stop_codon:yes gene_type:complete